jgi:L-lactate dehydrogenase (cytochrome)
VSACLFLAVNHFLLGERSAFRYPACRTIQQVIRKMGTYHVVPVTAQDYRRLSAKRLPRFLFDYIDGGAGEERSLKANVADFGRYKLRQRVMVDVDAVDTATELAGQKAGMPVVLAPVGLAGMFGRRGEVQGARGAASAGVPFTTSTVGICPVEEVQAAVSDPVWFQLYMLRDRGVVEAMLNKAWRSGSRTLVFTVDLAVMGPRYRDPRNGMFGDSPRARLTKAWQLLSRPAWLLDVGIRGKPHDFGNLREIVGDNKTLDAFKVFFDAQIDPTVTWRDISWLRQRWAGKLLIKGVMTAQDAVAAADSGADGIVVSNHGGRQLEGVASSISKLPEVVAAVGDDAEVLMDGGVRSGTDVVKALALGARGVMIGRPWVWAMSARGEDGVISLLEVMRKEIEMSMALMGVTRIDQISPDQIEP